MVPHHGPVHQIPTQRPNPPTAPHLHPPLPLLRLHAAAVAGSHRIFPLPRDLILHLSLLIYAYATAPPSPSLRISIGRSSSSPVRSSVSVRKRTCMCSPTTHSGSFRCNLHRSKEKDEKRLLSSSRLNLRRSAMKNSLVRIGTVEGDWVRRPLTALIRPSSHQLRRRSGFRPRRSRLSIVSNAEDSVAVVV